MKGSIPRFLGLGLWIVCLGALGCDGDAQGQQRQVEWLDVVGVRQTANLVGTGSGQLSGAGQPFSTSGGRASVNLDSGEIRFEVDGLVFAGGNAVGSTGSFSEVQGVLICDTDGSATGDSVLVRTPFVSLSRQGDAEFDGIMSIDPVCANEPDIAFLILNPRDMWIANGAIRTP